jgi:hypothetical protein
MMAIQQAKRFNYTRRDLLSYHSDVSKYMQQYVTDVNDTSEMNSGRVYLTIHEGLMDNANFAVDQVFLEAQLKKARQRKNILQCSYMLDYYPSPVSAASVDLTISMLSGVAPVGGQSIPIYTRFQTTIAPIIEFLSVEAVTIPEGESSITVQAVQGKYVSNEVLTSSASGKPDQRYTLANAKTPHDLIEIWVDGTRWTKVDDFASSDEDDRHFILQFDEDDYTSVIFGDDENGDAPDNGSQILANYIYTEAEDGNAVDNSIQKVVGSLASTVGSNNTYKASGGAASESNESIKLNAPANRRSYNRAVTRFDYVAEATAVAGVYKAFAIPGEGARTDIYILPEGGGIASSYLIDQVQTRLDSKALDGAIPAADTLQEAGIVIAVNVVTYENNIAKSTVKKKVIDETSANLEYTELTRGRAFTLSDLSGIYENIDNGELIDYIDFTILTRVPRIKKSNDSAPDFVGRVKITSAVGYDTYLVTAISTTQFYVSKNGTPQSTAGTVATEYTTDGGEITFTLGETGDTLTAGNTWLFKTSKYRDNIVIDSDEVMKLEKSSDLIVNVFYPGEYDIVNQAAA